MSISNPVETASDASVPLPEEVDALVERLRQVREVIGQVIFGQEQVVDETLITLLAGGHALLIGVPGLGQDATRGDPRNGPRTR